MWIIHTKQETIRIHLNIQHQTKFNRDKGIVKLKKKVKKSVNDNIIA